MEHFDTHETWPVWICPTLLDIYTISQKLGHTYSFKGCWLLQNADLEGRVSTLHQIKEDEQLIDSLLESAWWWTKPLAHGLSSRPRRSLRLWDVLWSRWKSLGHYRELCSSIRSAPLPLLHLRSHGLLYGNQKNISRKTPRQSDALELGNRYRVLEELEISASGRTSNFARKQVDPCHLNNLQWNSSITSPKQPSRRKITQERRSSPTVLIVGSSMIQNVSIRKAETICYPGARIQDIDCMIPLLISKHPTASAITVQVGSNDIKRQASEHLKWSTASYCT